MKKTFKKLINATLALLLLMNLCFSGTQTSIPDHSEEINPYGIVDDLEIR